MEECIFGTAFADGVRRLAGNPDSERLILGRLAGRAIDYLELLAWWRRLAPADPPTAKHALDLLMARLSAEGWIMEVPRQRREHGIVIPEWTLTAQGERWLRAALPDNGAEPGRK